MQHYLRLLQIRRVKSLSKPVVHWCEQVAGVLALVLRLPQASEAGGGAVVRLPDAGDLAVPSYHGS